MKLRPGAKVDEILLALEGLAANIHNEARPLNSFAATGSEARDAYVSWAVTNEVRLLNYISRHDVLEILNTPRYRDICLMPDGVHLKVSVNAEIDAMSSKLRSLARELRAERDAMVRITGCPAVLDSNVLLQCLLPSQIKWNSVIGEQARLMLPLRVIEELDMKKYGDNKRLRGVARGVLSWIEGLLTSDSSGPMSVGDNYGSTLELLLPDSPRRRPEDADEEIIDEVVRVNALTGRGVVVTADTGMLLRARALGLRVSTVREPYLRATAEIEAVAIQDSVEP